MGQVRQIVAGCTGLSTYHWMDKPGEDKTKMRVRVNTKQGTPAELMRDPAERMEKALQSALTGKVFEASPTLPLEGD